MKLKNQLLSFVMMGLLLIGFSSCSDDDDSSSGETQVTIAAFASSNSNYSELVQALTLTDLVGAVSDTDANLTVLAPDNDAFARFLTSNGFANLEAVPTDVLKNTLLYHVIGTELKAADVLAAVPADIATLATNADGSNIDLNIDADLMINNGDSEITAPDAYDASNGVIHGVSEVITLPATVPPVEVLTIAGFVESNENYSSLLAALQATDLVDTLDSEGPFTVFAPDNDAFDEFLPAAGFPNGLADVDTDEEIATVKNILLNHVIIGSELNAAAVIDSAPDYVTNGAAGPDDAADEATNLSTFYAVVDGNVVVNGEITVETPDAYDASNGIIHAVGNVIGLPKLSTFISYDSELSTLLSVLSTDLVATIDGFEPATVLAPNNAAFSDLATVPTGEALTDVLTYHVIDGTNYIASNIVDATTNVTMVNGDDLAVTPGPLFTGGGNTEAAGVVTADIQASNGVIHIIDTVLLPPADMIAVAK